MKIGLVPMSAKPYHKGHHYLVTSAAAQNDKVLLFVSTSDRCRKGEVPIYGSDMEDIWCNRIEKILPKNVTPIYGGSPVRKVYETLIAAEELLNSGMLVDTYTVYSDAEDTALNYTVGRSKKPGAIPPTEKYFPNLYLQGFVSFAAETNPSMFTRGSGAPDVSGTVMRNRLTNPQHRDRFISDLPEDLPDEDKASIYSQLRNRLSESNKLDRAILESYGLSRKKRPEKGTLEYSSYLEEIMQELQHVKSSYDSRKKSGQRYRKEASKIQDAYSELRRLKRRNDKKLDASKINEIVNNIGYDSNIIIDDDSNFSRDEIKSFFQKLKK